MRCYPIGSRYCAGSGRIKTKAAAKPWSGVHCTVDGLTHMQRSEGIFIAPEGAGPWRVRQAQFDTKFRQAFLDLEQRWLRLARSYELSERLDIAADSLEPRQLTARC